MEISLEGRIRALEDERDILGTIARYAFVKDHGSSADEFLDVFTPDAVWWSSSDGQWMDREGERFSGAAELLHHWDSEADVRNRPGHYVKHMLGPSQIRLAGDEATAETYLAVLVESENGPLVWMLGRYVDQLVRCADGRWRIADRHVIREDAQAAYRTE